MPGEQIHPKVAAYLENAPSDQRPVLVELREMIRSAMPDAVEDFRSGFPVYLINGCWAAGFASRAKGPMLYIMAPGVLDAWAPKLGALRSGKSCVDFKATKSTTLDELRAMAAAMLADARRSLAEG